MTGARGRGIRKIEPSGPARDRRIMRDCIVCKAPAHAAFCAACQSEADRRESEFVASLSLGGRHRITCSPGVCVARLSRDKAARHAWRREHHLGFSCCGCGTVAFGGGTFDHERLWLVDRRPQAVTLQPYGSPVPDEMRRLVGVLAPLGLTIEDRGPGASWHYPGATTLLVIRRADIGLLEGAARECASRSKQPPSAGAAAAELIASLASRGIALRISAEGALQAAPAGDVTDAEWRALGAQLTAVTAYVRWLDIGADRGPQPS